MLKLLLKYKLKVRMTVSKFLEWNIDEDMDLIVRHNISVKSTLMKDLCIRE